jgi:hypothetical protein
LQDCRIDWEIVHARTRLDKRIRLGIEQEAHALGRFLGARCDAQFVTV